MRRFCLLLVISACAFAQTDAHDWLVRGIQAFKSARYDEAVEAFQHAVDLDANDANAQMYLATAYFVQYIPGATSPENMAIADKARSGYERVLTQQPDNKTAMQYLGSLAFQTASAASDREEKFRRLDVASSWYQKLVTVDPGNKEAWYSLGVIDWMKWYPQYMAALTQAGMRPDEAHPIPNSNLRLDLKNSSGQLVEKGLSNLAKALEIDPQYSDAMAYMNLLVRERASLDDTQKQYDKDVLLADDWVRRTLEARKATGAEDPAPPPPPPPPPPAETSAAKPIRVAVNLQAAKPIYPEKAKHDGIQGTVRFRAIIGKDGTIKTLNLISGPPALVDAARDAVQQWAYRPTLVDGEPVEVTTTIDVNFTLSK